MSVEQPHPLRRYANLLLMGMHNRSISEMTLRKSVPLPLIEDQPEVRVPAFVYVRNKLKIMANVDHLKPLKVPTTSTFQLIFSNELRPACLQKTECKAHILFDDRPPDPSIHIRLEHVRDYVEDGVLWQ